MKILLNILAILLIVVGICIIIKAIINIKIYEDCDHTEEMLTIVFGLASITFAVMGFLFERII